MFSQQRQQEQHSIQQPRRKLASLCLLAAMMIAYPLPASAFCFGLFFCADVNVDVPDNVDHTHTLELSQQLQRRVDRGIVTLRNFNSLIGRLPGLTENVNEDIKKPDRTNRRGFQGYC